MCNFLNYHRKFDIYLHENITECTGDEIIQFNLQSSELLW